MDLIFKENIRLRRILMSVFTAFYVAVVVKGYKSLMEPKALFTVLISFILITLAIIFIVGNKDHAKLLKLMRILYQLRDPEVFLSEFDKAIDLKLVTPSTKVTILIHKANALCYSGEEQEALSLLEGLDEGKKVNNNQIALVRGNRITFRLLNDDLENLDTEIEAFDAFLKEKYKAKDKDLADYHKKNLEQKKILYKIASGKDLSKEEVSRIWDLLHGGGNAISIENLRYFAALYLLKEKDKTGAIEQLSLIRTEKAKTAIERKAKALLVRLQSET